PERERKRAERQQIRRQPGIAGMQPDGQRQRGGNRREEEEARPPEPATIPRPPVRIDYDHAADKRQPEQVEGIELCPILRALRQQVASRGQEESRREKDQPLAEGEEDSEQAEENGI